MGKTEILCPHCNQERFKIETDKKTEQFKKMNGGIYHRPLLTRATETQWHEDPNRGLGVQCKCGRHFFLTDFGNPGVQYNIHTSLPDGQTIAVYCGKCGRSFVSPDLQCPTCGNQL